MCGVVFTPEVVVGASGSGLVGFILRPSDVVDIVLLGAPVDVPVTLPVSMSGCGCRGGGGGGGGGLYDDGGCFGFSEDGMVLPGAHGPCCLSRFVTWSELFGELRWGDLSLCGQ